MKYSKYIVTHLSRYLFKFNINHFMKIINYQINSPIKSMPKGQFIIIQLMDRHENQIKNMATFKPYATSKY